MRKNIAVVFIIIFQEEHIPSNVIKELKHCSFQPNLESTKKSLQMLQTQHPPATPKGAERFVERLQQGHMEREQLQQVEEKRAGEKRTRANLVWI